MAEFRHHFKTYLTALLDLVDDILENTFLNRLLSATKAKVVGREPIGLEDIMK